MLWLAVAIAAVLAAEKSRAEQLGVLLRLHEEPVHDPRRGRRQVRLRGRLHRVLHADWPAGPAQGRRLLRLLMSRWFLGLQVSSPVGCHGP